MDSIPRPSEPQYFYAPKPPRPGPGRRTYPEPPPNRVEPEALSFWGKFWLAILLLAVAFLVGTFWGRNAERQDLKARVADFRAEQAQTARVPYAE